jgi:hypothetical protein
MGDKRSPARRWNRRHTDFLGHVRKRDIALAPIQTGTAAIFEKAGGGFVFPSAGSVLHHVAWRCTRLHGVARIAGDGCRNEVAPRASRHRPVGRAADVGGFVLHVREFGCMA